MKVKRIPIVLMLIILFYTGLTGKLYAQPSLYFQTISVNWPTITLITQVKCDSGFQMNLQKENFALNENGIDIPDFTITSADTSIPTCMSVALVFDRSGSMSGGTPSGIEGEKSGGKAFVDEMNNHCDEAEIISFNSYVTIDVLMTADKQLLKQAIDGLKAGGNTAVFDACMIGIQQLVLMASQKYQAVILLTDDDDGHGYPDDVIYPALQNKIRVFTIGLGTGLNDADLSRIANETGGKYYKVPRPENLVEVYKEIYRTIRNGYYQTEISYNAICQDGSKRNVNLTVQNLSDCSGKDTKTKSFKAPRDTSTFIPISIELKHSFSNQNSFVEVPIRLNTFFTDIFQPATFKITFDTTCLRFAGCYVDNTLLDGVGVNTTSTTNGVIISTLQPKIINDSGVIANLVFQTFARGDSTYRLCPITLSDWRFQSGCFKVMTTSGDIVLDAAPEKIPEEIFLSQNYPNPFKQFTTIQLPLLLGEGWGEVSLKVYDIFGREVLDLSDQARNNSSIKIQNSQLPFPGMYYYQVRIGNSVQTKKMILIR